MPGRGTLYGISVGPGDPELLTLKAVRILRDCPVVAAPRTPSGGMVALDIAARAVDLEDKELLTLDFAMARDAQARGAAHSQAVEQLKKPLAQGRSVAVLNLGDVSLYGSFPYLARQLVADFPVEMIPGVPSFCAAASRFGISLTRMDRPLHLIPGGVEELTAAMPVGTRVYMKSGRQLGKLLDRLEQEGVLPDAILVQNCGMAQERIFYGAAIKDAPPDYFSLVILPA